MSQTELVDRAQELAIEQRERYDAFKRNRRESPNNLIREFYKDPFEAEQAFLIMNHLWTVRPKKKTDSS